MRYAIVALLALATACTGASPRPDALTDTPTVTPQPREFDPRLTEYAYPYEVKFFTLEAQRATYELAYMDVKPTGTPNGETVLLLHGKNFSGAYWANTIRPLVERGYRVIAPDQLGFGKSSKPGDFQYTFHALATHTSRLLKELGVERATVVGHSMGGMVATRFALMFPDATTRLVLVNPIGLEDWKAKGVPYLAVERWYANELKKTPDKVKAYMTESYFDGQWKPEYEPLVELQAGWTEDAEYNKVAWVSALTYDMIYTQPVVYEFGRVKAPTLLIIGDRDRTALGKGLVSAEVRATLGQYGALGEEAAAAFPNASLVKLEGVGHIPQFEAFDAYFAALDAFLKGE
ncbi:MAG: alpha/beta hydrolase [Myxococcales bacterium]|nr:alpha/beta hydrolase [Myxococcales bacterium]